MADSTTAAPAPLREALSRHPFFSDLTPARLDRLAACARLRDIGAGEMLFHQGGDADRFFVLTRGTVCVENRTDGRPSVLQTLHEGDVLGWSWLTPPFRWAFDARAAAPGQVVEVAVAPLRLAFAADGAFGYAVVSRFAGVMGQRLRAAHMLMLERGAG
ncbi:cyclic nucleotide-binding domain-containing protein [Caenispirillum bisanense]|uniref:Crp/Fnr family transcriptional regulator n=1 Tax=Caenispirillum bisanense TaxID=414052 RepID=UPI0031CFEB31